MLYFSRPIYYAHSLRIYGTNQERKEVSEIRRLFRRRVINPNGKLPNGDGWAFEAFRLIDQCRTIVFSLWREHIGKGVWTELDYAFSKKYPVQLLLKREIYQIKKSQVRIVEHGMDWVRYAQIVDSGAWEL